MPTSLVINSTIKEVESNTHHLKLGANAENIACSFLQKQGLKLIKRNFRTKYGEIDLIMNQQSLIVFIEVRYRKNDAFGSGIESVDKRKQNKIALTAYSFLQQSKKWGKLPARFDIVSISPGINKMNIEWVPDAFTTDI